MRKLLAITILATLALVACGPAEPEGYLEGDNPNAPTETAPAESTPTETSGGGVQIQGGAAGAGGLAPVTGTENLQGGGGGVGQAAKDQARRVSGSAGSSIDQMSTDGE